MDSQSKDEFVKAKAAAFRLLKIRNRSEKEIRDRLTQKRFTKEAIARTVQDLKNIRLLDDRQFTGDWIQWRLKKPLGLRRIAFELKAKGIDENLIKEELKGSTQNYEEQKIIEEVAQRYLRKSGYFMTQPEFPQTGPSRKAAEKLDQLKIKRRLFTYLAHRGFTIESIQRFVEAL